MKIYDHWAKADGRARTPDGSIWSLVKWGGSDVSVDDAKAEAEKNLSNLQDRVTRDDLRNVFYYVSAAPVLEPVIERFGDHNAPYAAITRNRYGALVLNAANVFFADVDLDIGFTVPQETEYNSGHPEKAGFFQRLFGGKHKSDDSDTDRQNLLDQYEKKKAVEQKKALGVFAEFHAQFPSLSFRVYETAAGYRVMVTSQTVDVLSEDSEKYLSALASDKLYRQLCKQQQCYRARLSPKPWRLPGIISTVFYPDGQHELSSKLTGWLKQYDEASKAFSVCKLAESYGDGTIADEVANVLEIHDQYVLNASASRLA